MGEVRVLTEILGRMESYVLTSKAREIRLRNL